MAILLVQSRFFLLHDTIHKQGHPLPDFHIFFDLQIYLCNKICITYTPSPAKRIITLHANKIFKGGGKEGLRPPLIVKTKKNTFLTNAESKFVFLTVSWDLRNIMSSYLCTLVSHKCMEVEGPRRLNILFTGSPNNCLLVTSLFHTLYIIQNYRSMDKMSQYGTKAFSLFAIQDISLKGNI